MGWKRFGISVGAAINRAGREADRERHRAQAAADREARQLEQLRMKALGEQAKGKPGVWTAEYEGRLAAYRQRQAAAAQTAVAQREASARTSKGCLVALLGLAGIGALGLMLAALAGDCSPQPNPRTSATAAPSAPRPARRH